MTFRQIAVSVTRTIRKLTATKQSFAIVGFWPIAADPKHYGIYALRVAMRSARPHKVASA